MSSRLRTALAAVVMAMAGMASAALAGEPEWVRQFGVKPGPMAQIEALGVATGPQGRVHVAGWVRGAFYGPPKGYDDAFAITFDGDGTELWRRQPGTGWGDQAYAVATDVAGNVYSVGTVYSEGPGHVADLNASVIAFDADGRILWRRQPGTTEFQEGHGVATGADGGLYVVGETQDGFAGTFKGYVDAFVIKYDLDGRILWKRQPGSTELDRAWAVATHSDGSVYVAGEADGSLGGTYKGVQDAFLIKYDRDGHTLWKRQPGSPGYDGASGVATDADGNVYVAGTTTGWLGGPSQGNTDAFLLKYDRDGRTIWRKQPGTPAEEYATSVATDADSNVYLVGSTRGALAGDFKGKIDAFVIKYDRDGQIVWQDQPGTDEGGLATSVATDADGNVYVTGGTGGVLPGCIETCTPGAFLIKYGPDGPQ